MMDGFAIPHAKSSVIRRPFISVIKLREAIDWDSLDGQKSIRSSLCLYQRMKLGPPTLRFCLKWQGC